MEEQQLGMDGPVYGRVFNLGMERDCRQIMCGAPTVQRAKDRY